MINLMSHVIRNIGFISIKLLVVIATLGINTMPSDAQDATIQVYADQTIKQISRYLTGACIEDVNHEIYGGIYSQMIFGESFEEGPMKIDPRHPDFQGLSGTVSCIAKRRDLSRASAIRSWQPFRKDFATGNFKCFNDHSYNGEQSQTIAFLTGEGEIGIENQGLNRWGMNFIKDKPYEGYIWVKAEKDFTFFVALESAGGDTVYSENELKANSNTWHRIDFELTPGKSDKSGRFAIKLKNQGSLHVGHVFLQPGPWGRFKDLPLRKDVVEGLIREGITVLRYGGSMVNYSEEYRWKNMVGPRDKRPPYTGTWYEYSSNGWGIIDFVDLCEAAGFQCVPAFNTNETAQDMADFVEYMNGPATSEWGKIRSENGHPDPYNLKYIQIGNEQQLSEFYPQFEILSDAIWKKDNTIQIIVGLWNVKNQDKYFQKILDFAAKKGHDIWFDIHVWNDEPEQPDLSEIEYFLNVLDQISEHRNFKICVLEENAVNHSLHRGLGHAHAINLFERWEHEIPILCAANCLQPYKQNDNFWDQGLLFLSPSQVWGQPSYYVTQMVSRNYLPEAVKSACKSTGDVLDVTAKKSEDGKQLNIQVLNIAEVPVKSSIELIGFTPKEPMIQVIQLKGELHDVNTPEEPEKIIPWGREYHYETVEGKITYTFPPYSFTILKIM